MQFETQEELNKYKTYAFKFSRKHDINLIYVESEFKTSQMKFVEIGADAVSKNNKTYTYAVYNFRLNGKIILSFSYGSEGSYSGFEKTMLFEFMKRRKTNVICKLKKYVDI